MTIKSARNALAWAGGVQIAQDLAQFAAMLIMVRLLSPEEYGAMAFAQAILGVFTLAGPGAFVGHALQARDPDTVDWQWHYTFSVFLSLALVFLINLLALVIVLPIWGPSVAIALSILSLAVLIGGWAHVRNTYLFAHHDWARFRLLSLIGTVLGLGVGLGLGFAGAGVVALAVQPVLSVLPYAVDSWRSCLKLSWRFDRSYHGDTLSFGLNRMVAGSMLVARGIAEQSLMAEHFSLGVNGIYSRSLGLANLLAGRFGGVAVGALYPIITRAECGSPLFRHTADRVLQGIAWTSIPAGTFLALEAKPMVELLYGSGWAEVANLLPASAAVAVASALLLTSGRLLLANESRRASLAIDAVTGLAAIVLAVVFLPQGPGPYLQSLAAMLLVSLVPVSLSLVLTSAANLRGLIQAFVIPCVASAAAAYTTSLVRTHIADAHVSIYLMSTSLTFGFVYAIFLFALARRVFLQLMLIIPGFDRVRNRVRVIAKSHQRRP